MPMYDFRCGEGHRFERLVPLARFSEVQACECGAPAQRLISAPSLACNDQIAPTWGADGRQHTSLAAYRATLRPDGNPMGERFIEMGNEKPAPWKPPEFDRKTRRDAIRAGIADMKAGRVPPLATGEPT